MAYPSCPARGAALLILASLGLAACGGDSADTVSEPLDAAAVQPAGSKSNQPSGGTPTAPSEDDSGIDGSIDASGKGGSKGSDNSPDKGGSNQPPTLSGSPPTSVDVGSSYAFKPSASDPDGDRLRFGISNLPAWAQFSRKSGRLSGTPSASHVGTTRNVTISVTDGPRTTTLLPFDIEVTTASTEPDPADPIEGNEPPTLSGTPPTEVAVGERYDFTPKASDPDGDPLRFSVSNRPAWMTFDSGSGRLTGTPSQGDVGQYTQIVIKVSDGEATDSLSAFDVQVSGTGGSAVSLSWTPPTEREDGTALDGLAGYRIHLGRDQSSLDQVIEVPNGGVASYTIEALSAGTWYFAVQAYDKAGLRSRLSGFAQAVVD